MVAHIHVNLPAEDDDELDEDEFIISSDLPLQLDKNGKTPYTEITVRFASNKVRERVTQELEARIRQRLLDKTKAGTGSPILGSSFEL
jgi:hypothetical protein